MSDIKVLECTLMINHPLESPIVFKIPGILLMAKLLQVLELATFSQYISEFKIMTSCDAKKYKFKRN